MAFHRRVKSRGGGRRWPVRTGAVVELRGNPGYSAWFQWETDVRERSLAELLGRDAGARLLIVNADDFGMCQAENAATIEGLEQGAYRSATVMVPCPWFPDAAAYARRHPEADLGVHLTHTSEWETYRWGPTCGRSAVPSLVDTAGHLHRSVSAVYAQARLEEIERETRMQIELALEAGIDVSHLDSHMGTMQLDPRYHMLYVRLGAEYRVPIRTVGRRSMSRVGMDEVLAQADRLGVLMPDHFHYGGPPSPEETSSYWVEVFARLLPGVTEIYLHPAHRTPEIEAIAVGWRQRVADHAFFTSSESSARLAELGIETIGYRAIRDLQRSSTRC